MPVNSLTKSTKKHPIAAMLLARIARQFAAQGNIKTSNSGRSLSGHNNPATPNARHIWTMRQSSKAFISKIPFVGLPLLLKTNRGVLEKLPKFALGSQGETHPCQSSSSRSTISLRGFHDRFHPSSRERLAAFAVLRPS